VIVAGAREALSAPTTRQYGSPDLNVPVPAESGPLWNSQDKLDGAFNGHKSGVHEGSLPRFLLEDSPNVNGSLLRFLLEDSPNVYDSLPSHGFAWASPVPPRFQQTNEPTAAFLVSSKMFLFYLCILTLALFCTIVSTSLSCMYLVSRWAFTRSITSACTC
jgi:hypothetical protein